MKLIIKDTDKKVIRDAIFDIKAEENNTIFLYQYKGDVIIEFEDECTIEVWDMIYSELHELDVEITV